MKRFSPYVSIAFAFTLALGLFVSPHAAQAQDVTSTLSTSDKHAVKNLAMQHNATIRKFTVTYIVGDKAYAIAGWKNDYGGGYVTARHTASGWQYVGTNGGQIDAMDLYRLYRIPYNEGKSLQQMAYDIQALIHNAR